MCGGGHGVDGGPRMQPAGAGKGGPEIVGPAVDWPAAHTRLDPIPFSARTALQGGRDGRDEGAKGSTATEGGRRGILNWDLGGEECVCVCVCARARARQGRGSAPACWRAPRGAPARSCRPARAHARRRQAGPAPPRIPASSRARARRARPGMQRRSGGACLHV